MNFGLFYKHEGKKSHFVPLIRKCYLVDIQYIRDIKKNKFKLKNIMKLSTSIQKIRKTAKSFKIGTSSLEIETKEEDYIAVDVKRIISLI